MKVERTDMLRTGLAARRGRRGFVIGGVALLGVGWRPTLVLAQEATPEVEADPEPEADPTAGTDAARTPGDFTLYSGRNQTLVEPIIDTFAEETGTTIDVRYGGTGELAVTILEEGDNTPAAAFFAQDAGSLGLLATEGRLQSLPADILDLVDPRFRDTGGRWIGVSGRARVLAYNTDVLAESDLPASVKDLTDPKWADRIGWAPENASFQSFVTAFRLLEGDDAARAWLEAMIANGAVNFGDSNSAIVKAVGEGEIDAGLVNHYYVYVVRKEEGDDFPVANHFFASGDPGSLVNVAGYGVITNAEAAEQATSFLQFLLSEEGQRYFTTETFEYPLIAGIAAPEGLPPLAELQIPNLDLGSLADLRGTLELLTEVGLL